MTAYQCQQCDYVALSLPAARRHAKGLESPRADSTPLRPAHVDGWGINPRTGYPLQHTLERVNNV